jgi:hypothetical protein
MSKPKQKRARLNFCITREGEKVLDAVKDADFSGNRSAAIYRAVKEYARKRKIKA